MTLSVIVVTLNRPDYVRKCLDRLLAQEPAPEQVIVVDSSADDRTRSVVGTFAGVEYLRNELGPGHMTHSRNIALLQATGQIIAFIDDDSFVHPGWSQGILELYSDPKVGAVGGRALNNNPNETTIGVDQIGKLLPNGQIAGFFAADPGHVIEVDHIIGCNMSFRRDVLAKLGGLREDYPGTEVREESDLCLRVRALGYRIVFNPAAVVDHVAAPHAVGRRFDNRYVYYSSRNHMVLLIQHFGFLRAIFWRSILGIIQETCVEFLRQAVRAVLRVWASVSGLIVGIFAGSMLLIRNGRSPIRNDATGQKLTKALNGGGRLPATRIEPDARPRELTGAVMARH